MIDYIAGMLYKQMSDAKDAKKAAGFSLATLQKQSPVTIAWAVVSLAVSLYAAYLSWSCNSKAGLGVFWTLLRAVLAFAFGFFYLAAYFVFWSAKC